MMKDFFDNSKFDSDDSSIFQGKILDFSAEQERNKLKEITEELARKAALKTLECERQASDQIDNILQLIKIDDDYFADSERLLENFYILFRPLFNFFDVDMGIGSKTYEMIKERREKNLLLSIIKFMNDKLKELVKKIFSRDLSFDERLAKEIKELEEKLAGGGLSKEEFARVFERLEALTNLKLKLQMFLTGWLITTFAEIFAVNLVAAVETGTTKEEDRKAEKTSSKEKEANKEIDAEIKLDEKKSQLTYGVIPASIWLERPISLTTQEHNLLLEPIRKIVVDSSLKLDINNKESGVKERKVEEAPKMAVCPPKSTGQPVAKEAEVDYKTLEGSDKSKREKSNTISNVPIPKSIHKQKMNGFCAELAEIMAQAKPQNSPPVDHRQEQVRSKVIDNGKSNASAVQQGSMNNAQENPKSKFTDILGAQSARRNGHTVSRSC